MKPLQTATLRLNGGDPILVPVPPGVRAECLLDPDCLTQIAPGVLVVFDPEAYVGAYTNVLEEPITWVCYGPIERTRWEAIVNGSMSRRSGH